VILGERADSCKVQSLAHDLLFSARNQPFLSPFARSFFPESLNLGVQRFRAPEESPQARPSSPAFQLRSSFFALCALTLNQIGVPAKPKASRIWFSRKRSKLKCSLISRSVNSTNVGGATAAYVM